MIEIHFFQVPDKLKKLTRLLQSMRGEMVDFDPGIAEPLILLFIIVEPKRRYSKLPSIGLRLNL